MPTSISPRRSSRRWPLAEVLLLAVLLPLLHSSCKTKTAPPGKGRPRAGAKASGATALDAEYSEAVRLYEAGKVEEAAGKLEALTEKGGDYPYLGDIYDLLADCYSALDRPADEYRCLLKALDCYRAGGLTKRYRSTEEAIERIESYLPLLREQIKAQGEER